MTDVLWIVLMFLAGGLLAGAWLAALWRSVRNLPATSRPYMTLAWGALVRLSILAAGLYLVIAAAGHWTHLLAALAGFIAVRSIALSIVRRRDGAKRSDFRDAA